MVKCGLMMLKWQFGGAVPMLIIMMHLVKPAIPAPASKCAMLLFALVFRIGTLRSCITAIKAPTSIGSPRAVPVPWHSAIDTVFGLIPAKRMDFLITCCCAGPLGAVKLALRPSWLVAVPIKAQTRSSSSCLSPWYIFTKTAPQPSPLWYPSALRLNVKLRPWWESMVAMQLPMNEPGPSNVLTPTTKASALSALGGSESNIQRWAAFIATREAEHAVSYDDTGPRISKVWAIRAAVVAQLMLMPMVVGQISGQNLAHSVWKECQSGPTSPNQRPIRRPFRLLLLNPDATKHS